MRLTKNILLGLIFLWFLIGGLGHFIWADLFVSIVPPWVPWPYAAVYVTGVFELIGAVGILISRYRSIAGIGLILLTLAVTPANIYMWLNSDQFPGISENLLLFRLFFQIFFIWCIWWSTRKNTLSIG